jgi:hypothetical protein
MKKLSILAVIASVMMFGCGDEKDIPVINITLQWEVLTLVVDEETTIEAEVFPENATDKVIKWSSSDEQIATVTENGKVTAVKAGKATITAKAGGKDASCEVTVNDKNNEINATVENGASLNVNEVKARLGYSLSIVDGEAMWTGFAVASGDFVNGGFTLKLPETVPASELASMVEDGEYPEGITVNPATAKIASIGLIIAYKDGKQVGRFKYTDGGNWEAFFSYADRDVTVKGSSTSTNTEEGWTNDLTYDVSLTKGWNVIYIYNKNNASKKSSTLEATSTKPAGLKWVFDPGAEIFPAEIRKPR